MYHYYGICIVFIHYNPESGELLCWCSNTHGQLTHKESVVTKPRKVEVRFMFTLSLLGKKQMLEIMCNIFIIAGINSSSSNSSFFVLYEIQNNIHHNTFKDTI